MKPGPPDYLPLILTRRPEYAASVNLSSMDFEFPVNLIYLDASSPSRDCYSKEQVDQKRVYQRVCRR